MFQEVDIAPAIPAGILQAIPDEALPNLFGPFGQSKDLKIPGLTILLPINPSFRTKSGTEGERFSISLHGKWESFLRGFRESLQRHGLEPAYQLQFKIFYHVIEDPRKFKEFALGILEDPKHKITFPPLYCLDAGTGHISVLGDDGWRRFESYQTPL